jgi:proline iminopeptidase
MSPLKTGVEVTQTIEIERDGYLLSARREGSGISLLVLGSSTYYPRCFSDRLKARFQFSYADLRHFAKGPEERAGNLGLATYVDDIDRLRNALGLGRVILLGHSHHGNVAVEYARANPAAVAGLVLIGTPPCNVDDTLREADRYWRQDAEPARKRCLESRWAKMEAAAAGTHQTFVDRYVADAPRYWFDPGFDASGLWREVPINLPALQAFKQFFVDYEFRLHGLESMPVLVVMGRHDYVVPHTLWTDSLRRQRNIGFHLLERSGHTPSLEQPDVFDPLLSDWVSSIRGF